MDLHDLDGWIRPEAAVAERSVLTFRITQGGSTHWPLSEVSLLTKGCLIHAPWKADTLFNEDRFLCIINLFLFFPSRCGSLFQSTF